MTPNKKLKNGVKLCYRSECKTIKMKRSVFMVLAILLLSAGLFSACEEREENAGKTYSAKEGRFEINENEFALMRLSPENGSINSSIFLIIENHTTAALIHGQDYSLEYFNNGKWKEIQLDGDGFPMIGYILNSGETVEKPFSLSQKYFKKLGTYRMIKNFSLDSASYGDYGNFNLCVEFEIK